ncbi:MAG: glycosyl hydrolase [Chloroflexi bacterium]|nr:glycosyl hydrolase [Chloroflexota bacterium]
MDPRLFTSLEWRCIGPHRGGRVVTVAGHPTELGTFYFGGCAGGVFKTTNGGSHWENVSDGYFNTAAVGAIAVSDSDPNVIYAGTGEACIRSNVSHGDGVYRSDDGGTTWRNIGLAPTRHISHVVIHPHDPDTVYVAALGHAWGPNPERGIYRSTNGGGSWDLVLHKSPRAGAADLTMDPRNPRVLYAAMWQGQRFPHAAESGGEDSGIWRSLDGGTTWTDLTHNSGLPKGILGRIGLAASPARAGRVWAIVEAEDGAMFRSDDYGETWEKLSDDPDLRRRPWYYMHTIADPSDANTVWVMNLQCWRSLDAGKTFEAVPTPHGDNHALWIDPRNSLRMIQGNDGGACVTFDGARSWSTLLNQPTAQFYHVTTDNHVPYRVYGSQQDNWAMRVPSISFEGAISWKDYVEPGGGESGYIAVSPKAPHLVFGGGIGTGPGHGRLIAWNPETGQKRNVTVWPEVFGMGAGADTLKHRFQWTFPVEFSPHEENTLYVCSNVVHRSTDEGASWEVISTDLTRNDPEKLRPSGGPITADNSGAEIYCTIFAFRESPHERGVFWAGSDDGLIHISRDGGQNWQNVTPPGLPEWSMIGIIEPSPHDPATAYVSATAYKSDDPRPFLFKTSDYGASWTQITNGIPADEFTRVIREDPNRRGLLYCGTERGIHVSLDDGDSWSFMKTNLPITPIWDLVIKDTDMVAATHGRAFWILDDLTPLYQMQAENIPASVSSTGSSSGSGTGNVSDGVHLFAPRDTVRYKLYGRAYDPKTKTNINYKMTGPVTVGYKLVETPSGRRIERFYDAGQNPPEGVIIHYWLGTEPESVKLTILDSAGNEVRSYSNKKDEASAEAPSEGEVQETTAEEEVSSESTEPVEEKGPWAPAQVGMNRFIWDYRYAKPVKLERKPPKRGGGDEAEAAAPPRAVPGEYEVRLTVGQQTESQRFKILPDPRLPVTEADLKAQFDLKLGIRDRLSEAHECINRILKVRAQVEEWERRSPELKSSASSLKDRLNALEAELVNVDADKPRPGPNRVKEKLDTLGNMVDESDHAPTRGAQEVYEQLRSQLDDVRRRFDQLLQTEVKQFSERVQSLNVPAILV